MSWGTRARAACLLIAASGCSLAIRDPQPCRSDEVCRSAFGLGHFCAEQGFCQRAELPSRCAPHPASLFDNRGENPVLFGVLFDGDDPEQVRGARATRLAVDLANANGGLATLERDDFGLLLCDHQSDAGGRAEYGDGLSRDDAAVQMARFLTIDFRLPAVLGPYGSGDVDRVHREVAEGAPALVLSSGAWAASLTALDREPASDFAPGIVWRTVAPGGALVDAMAADLSARGVTRVSILAAAGPQEQSAARLAAGLGEGAVIGISRYGSNDLVDRLNAVAADEPQEIVLLADRPPDAVRVLEVAAADPRLSGRAFFLDQAGDDERVLGANAAALLDASLVRIARFVPAPRSDIRQNFRNLYRDAYEGEEPGPGPFAARSWDATWMLIFASATALGRDGSTLPSALGLGLRSLSEPEAPQITRLQPDSWVAASEALSRARRLDVEGASGDLDYAPGSEELAAPPLELVSVSADGGARRFVPAETP